MCPSVRSRTIRRDVPRSAGGSWAMSSEGRSKLKSRTSMSATMLTVVVQTFRSAERLVNRQRRPEVDFLRFEPLLGEDRPQRLIEAFTVPHERAPQQAFLHGAE